MGHALCSGIRGKRLSSTTAVFFLAVLVVVGELGCVGLTKASGNNGGSTPVTITSYALPDGEVSQQYQATAVATGGTARYTWSVSSGQLPTGLQLNANTGQITGTPTLGGQYTFSLQAADSGSPQQTATQAYNVGITNVTLDGFGGRTDIKCSTTTGWFHTEKVGNQWWLCTPAGNAFFVQSIYVVTFPPSSFNGQLSAKYGTVPAWVNATDQRLKSWGFNTLGILAYDGVLPTASDNSYPLDANGLHSLPTKLPFIALVRPALYAMENPTISTPGGGRAILLTEAVKNLLYGHSPSYTGWITNGIADYFDRNLETWLQQDLAQDLYWSKKNSPYFNYLLGISSDDGDQMFGFGAGPDFPTTPPGHNNPHLGWLVATMTPSGSA